MIISMLDHLMFKYCVCFLAPSTLCASNQRSIKSSKYVQTFKIKNKNDKKMTQK
jgi:hypothetical protein